MPVLAQDAVAAASNSDAMAGKVFIAAPFRSAII
jgi:hypothetical protein